MRFNPTHRKRSAVMFKICHKLPCEKCGASKKIARFFVGESQIDKRSVPNRFCSRNSKRHINTVQRHHIYFIFPSVPIPPGGAVGMGAVVHIYAELLFYNSPIWFWHRKLSFFKNGNSLSAP